LGTKSMDPLEAKIAIGRRKMEKLEKLRREGSSEMYWEMRTYLFLTWKARLIVVGSH
jgi:hypothetical protein